MAEPFARWFRFFDAMTVRIEGRLDRAAARGFARKFDAYQIDHDPGRADLTFRLSPFVPQDTPDARRFNDYRVLPGTISRTRAYKIARWSYEVAGLGGTRWVVRLDGNAASQLMMHHLTMTPWVMLALSVRGWVPVHAAAAVHPARPGSALVLAGRRGVGKTTLIGHLLRAGYHVVSEDRVLIREGVVYGLRVPINLKLDRADPKLAQLPADVRKRLRHKAILAALTRGYASLHEPIDPRLLLPDQLRDTCPLGRVFYLQSGPSLSIEDADPSFIARRLVLGNGFEDPATMEDVLAYRYCGHGLAGRAGQPWEADELALHDALRRPGVRLRKIIMPVRPDARQWAAVLEEVVA